MNSLEIIFLDCILICFPMFLYLIYLSTNKNLKNNKIYKNLMLISSFFLVLRFGYSQVNIASILILNVMVALAYKENSIILANIFASIIIYINNYNEPYILIIIYLLSIILYLIIKNRKAIIYIFMFISSFIYIYWVYSFNDLYFNVLNIAFTIISYIFIILIINYLYSLGEDILNLHVKLKEINKENQIKLSLFKITHEIKNPIAVCKGYLDMINLNDKKKSEKYVSIIKSEIERLLVLLQDFLYINKCNMDLDIMDFNLLVEDNLEKLKPILKEKNIKVNINLLDDEVYINGDYNRLSQVIINILKNSIEAINGESGIINIKSKIKDNKYLVEIEDNGEGMTNEIISKMREPFFTTKYRGSGLGISLIYEIIEAHGGVVNYLSEYGKGTCVIISIPLYE